MSASVSSSGSAAVSISGNRFVIVGGASLDADEFVQICRIAAGGS